MLNRYIGFEGFYPIPLTGRRYSISMSGVVKETMTEGTLPTTVNEHGEPYVLMDGWFVKVAVLLALATKQIHLPFTQWTKLDVLYVDNDCSHIHPGNLVWKFPVGGLFFDLQKEYAYIPGFTRYAVNCKGQVINALTGHALSPYRDQSGYLMYGVTPDVGKRTILGMHRAMALAFKEYPGNVDELDVNHIDGIKDNNAPDNHEWATRKRNCDHAYSTNLRDDNLETLVYNPVTKETQSYYSLEECARQLKVEGETIRLRTQSRGQKIYPPGLQFKLASDKTDWKTFTDPLKELIRSGVSCSYKVTHLVTGEIKTFPSAAQCAQYLNISNSTISWKFANQKPPYHVNEYLLERNN